MFWSSGRISTKLEISVLKFSIFKERGRGFTIFRKQTKKIGLTGFFFRRIRPKRQNKKIYLPEFKEKYKDELKALKWLYRHWRQKVLARPKLRKYVARQGRPILRAMYILWLDLTPSSPGYQNSQGVRPVKSLFCTAKLPGCPAELYSNFTPFSHTLTPTVTVSHLTKMISCNVNKTFKY